MKLRKTKESYMSFQVKSVRDLYISFRIELKRLFL